MSKNSRFPSPPRAVGLFTYPAIFCSPGLLVGKNPLALWTLLHSAIRASDQDMVLHLALVWVCIWVKFGIALGCIFFNEWLFGKVHIKGISMLLWIAVLPTTKPVVTTMSTAVAKVKTSLNSLLSSNKFIGHSDLGLLTVSCAGNAESGYDSLATMTAIKRRQSFVIANLNWLVN